jgi:putative oxidoreductase
MPYLRFPTLKTSLLVLRIGIPCLFMAHAITRIVKGTIPQFAQFMGSVGFPQPVLVVWLITLVELIAGTLLVLGYFQRYCAFALASIAAGGIVLIHARLGWFVGEFGTGGSEYSVCLLLALMVLAAADPKRDGKVSN